MTAELQHTVAKSAGFSGTSLHTGEKVALKLQPAPIDHGVKFKRKDLADEPTIDANIANLKTVERATTIGEGAVRVHTVEHVLSALSAMGVDNAIIEMTANEPPIGDGSAAPYVEVIKKAGTAAQEAAAFCRRIRAAQNSRCHRRPCAHRHSHSRSYHCGEAWSRRQRGAGAGDRETTRQDHGTFRSPHFSAGRRWSRY